LEEALIVDVVDGKAAAAAGANDAVRSSATVQLATWCVRVITDTQTASAGDDVAHALRVVLTLSSTLAHASAWPAELVTVFARAATKLLVASATQASRCVRRGVFA
jgi:hypothetical protein